MISSQTQKNQYTGNGAVDTYAYSFKIFDDDDLLVTVMNTSNVETTLVKTTDYTVTGVGAASGGNVVLVNSAQAWLDGDGDLITSYGLTIRRHMSPVQATDLRNQGSYYPEDVEDQLDKQTMVDLELTEGVTQSVKLPESIDNATFDPTLPTDIAEAPNKVLTVNAAGDGWELKEASEIAALAGASEHAITDGQSATSLTDETVAAADYTSAIYDYEVIRGTTVFVTGRLSLHYRNSTWYAVNWGENYDDSGAASGVTFSVTGTTTAQLKAALDVGAGNGTIKLKRHLFDA